MYPQVSIVIPIRNEVGNIASLISEINTTLNEKYEYEIIVVDDASTDESERVVRELMSKQINLRLLSHNANGGQSAAIHSGVCAAQGEVVCTLDGDGQNPPSEIPSLIEPILDPNASATLGLVAGQRVKRMDSLSRRLASQIANRIRVWVLRDGTQDTGCGLKAFRRTDFLEIPYFNHMHRYLPALFKRNGWSIALVNVAHRSRRHGQSNYTNLQRALVGCTDLLGVNWLIRRRKVVRAREHLVQ